ncbi:winged helix-turn-helix transcriptional regulator, partial [Candidatus Thorarchaeota archaeon]
MTMEIQVPLDEIDLDILRALEKGSKKISTTDMGKQLEVPGRTIRYHMNKLKEKGILKPPKIQTYERKLGLGERILLLQSIPEREDELTKILNDVSFFYYYSTTYGRYDGFLAYTMFPLVNPRITNQIADELKERGLISNYSIFDAIDYNRKGAAVEPFLPGADWTWSAWREEVEKIMKNECSFPLKLEEFPKVVRFDLSDIKILRHLVDNEEPTLKEISKELDLSMTQVHKRVKRLEKEGVLKGTMPVFRPYVKYTAISCFFVSKEHAQKMLCGFHSLPFEVHYTIESSSKYNVQVIVPETEVNEFLRNIDIFRRHSDDFFIQVIV